MAGYAVKIGSATLTRGPVSGLYERRELGPGSGYALVASAVESIRLDVDGWYPQMMASGSFFAGLYRFGGYVQWAASVQETSPGTWEGSIRGVWGDKDLLPYKDVKIQVPNGGVVAYSSAEMTVTFSGGAPPVTRKLQYASPYFRTADIEWDTVQGATRVTYIDTGAHPNRPATLPVQTLTMVEVFSRAGVDLRRSNEESVVPLSLADVDETWSDSELNDVMKQYWSRYKARAQWAMWLLFAGLHEDRLTRGIMFDYQGVYKRQGAAVFNDWWLTNVPDNYDHRDAHIRRRRFVTACHETGHCFNLIHSWEKPASGWWPLGGEPFALSFMNNPDEAPYPEQFFANFDYSFSDQELAFLRHAPEQFIEMGGIRYGDSVKDAAASSMSGWTLEASVSRNQNLFDFLEPVMLNLQLTNHTDRPQVIDEGIFRNGHSIAVSIARTGGLATELRPFVLHCLGPKWQVLQSGDSIHHTVFVSAGVTGWLISEPGPYEITVVLNTASVQAVSQPLRLRVACPRGREEESIAQDYFTEDVGRALAFGGTAVMHSANNVLERISDGMRGSPVARHAQLALGLPNMKARKRLRLPPGEASLSSVADDGGGIVSTVPQPAEARRLLVAALAPGDGVDTFGTEYLDRMVRRCSDWLDREGDSESAHKIRSCIKQRTTGAHT